MKTNKINALLSLKNKSTADYINELNISRQSYWFKTKNDRFNADDLLKLAKITNTKLAFIDDQKQIIQCLSGMD